MNADGFFGVKVDVGLYGLFRVDVSEPHEFSGGIGADGDEGEIHDAEFFIGFLVVAGIAAVAAEIDFFSSNF